MHPSKAFNYHEKPKEKQITVSDTGRGKQIVPTFKIKGKWLLKLGFTPHDVCRLTYDNGFLQISKIDE